MNWKFWKRRSRKDLEESVSILSADLATATVKADTLEKDNIGLSEDLRGSRAVVGNLIEDVRRLESSLVHCESKMEEQAKSIAKEQLESERAKAELAKTQAQLERAELHLQTQKVKMDELQKQMSATLEWIKETHHLNVPMANTPIRKLLSTLTSKRNSLVAALLLLPSLLFAQFPINTPYSQAWSQTNVLSLANSNATSKPLTNRHINGVTTLFGLEAGANIGLTVNGSNIVITGSGGAGDAGGTNARQFGTLTLTNLSGTGAVTNIVSLSTTNATSKPITNSYANGILTLYGLEQGSNVVLFMNGSNIVINGTGSGGLSFADLWWTNDQGRIHLSTNTFVIGFTDTNNFIFSDNRDNVAIGYKTGYGTATASENTFLGVESAQAIFNNTGDANVGIGYRSMRAATDAANNVAIGNLSMLSITTGSQNTGVGKDTLAAITTTSDNAAFGWDSLDNATGGFNSGFGSETLHFQGPGDYQSAFGYRAGFFSQSSFNTFLGATADHQVFPGVETNSTAVGYNAKFYANNQIKLGNEFVTDVITAGRYVTTNGILSIGHVYGNSNLFLSGTGMLGGLVATQDIRFLGHNSTSNFVWTCTNTTTGEGEWRAATGTGSGLTTNANQFGQSVELTIKPGAFLTNMNYFGLGTNHGNLYAEGDFTARNIMPENHASYDIGTALSAYNNIFLKAGVSFIETIGNDTIAIAAPTSVGVSYFLILPDAQGGNGDVPTNNGSGILNWWNAGNAIVAATNSASVTNWITTRQPANAVLSNLVGTVANNVTNVVSLSTTNATSKPLTNSYTSGVLTLFGLEQGANITLTPNGSNIVIAASGVAGDAGGTNARQFGTLTLTNLSGTGAITNFVSLSTSNATSKPLTNSYANGVITTYGLEQGSNVVLNVNGSNIVINPQWGLSNVVYVQRGQSLSNAFANAVSGTCFVLDTGTNQVRGTLPTAGINDYRFVDLKITNVHNIRIQGSGNTVIDATNGGIGFSIQNCSNVVISDVIFRAFKTNGTTYQNGAFTRHGTVSGWGTNSWTIFKNCRFEQGNEFALNASGEGAGVFVIWQDLQVLNCYFWQCGHTNYATGANNPDGGAMVFHPNLYMDGCVVDGCGRGIESHSGSEMSYNCIVRNTEFRNNWFRGINIVQSALNTRWLIDGCHFSIDPNARKGEGVIVAKTTSGTTIINCTFTNIGFNVQDACIIDDDTVLGSAKNVNVLNNTFANVVFPVYLIGQTSGRISGNFFENVRDQSVDFGGDGATVSDNYFLNCSTGGAWPVVWARVGGTNLIIKDNFFRRTSGSSPPSWIQVDSTTVGARIIGNVSYDVSDAVPLLVDTGVATKLYDAFGSSGRPITMNATTNYTVVVTDTVIGATNATTTGGARVVTLPSANQLVGRTITVFDPGRTAAGTNITINTVSGQIFNGVAGLTSTNVSQDGASMSMFSANGGWTIFEDSKDPSFGKAGNSQSNYTFNGTFFRDTRKYTNLNGSVTTFTNLGNTIIGAHTLTNVNDEVSAIWEGMTGFALQTTNQFRIVYGSETVIDTSLQSSSNIIFKATTTITRTGNTAQRVSSTFKWVPYLLGATGVPWSETNRVVFAVQTNGINTSLALMASSRRPGGITNDYTVFNYSAAPR